MKMTVTKKVSFDAAHYLPGYDGPCAAMHGHHWVVEVGVSGPKGEDGMVVDFRYLKEQLDPIVGKLDHSVLNESLRVPTAENLAFCIAGWLLDEPKEDQSPYWLEDLKLEFVRVWETEDSMAEVRL